MPASIPDRFRAHALLAALLAILLLPMMPTAHAATDLSPPYAGQIRKAMTAESDTQRQLNPDGGESATCRALRVQLERSRNATPADNDNAVRIVRDGIDQRSRYMPRVTPDPAASEAPALERQYLRECR